VTGVPILLATLRDIHEGLAWVMVVGNGLAGAWALAAHRADALRGRALWWFTALVQVVIAVQVTLGVGLVAGQDIEPPQFHLFYGFVALITVGIVYSYRQSLRPHRHLLYGFAGLFLMGLGIRAMIVA
ncbi:uncharacterized protein METZ01_LOCUS26676, partial [marine metagenome]|jgi:hypothetical protein|tara:strand:- start:48 stop:431 length:384 start_codon:yes stop_codon:yes gene_type:complete